MKRYPCRTEIITGTKYTIKMYRDGKHIMSTFYDTKNGADSWIEKMKEKFPNYKYEVIENPWTSNVCIECGKEEY